jgi:hypothetical protein
MSSPDFGHAYGLGLDFDDNMEDWEADDWKNELIDFFGESVYKNVFLASPCNSCIA